ncbi:hypothetical protein LTR15_012470 [Elasticomyces elasticus]|nr:hypothetical protein LTR15_012470 [Elasticomyces elasticus]
MRALQDEALLVVCLQGRKEEDGGGARGGWDGLRAALHMACKETMICWHPGKEEDEGHLPRLRYADHP